MEFERATPPALRWVVAFLAVCAVMGLWLGFKDQIRRNPPAWYSGAPDPTTPGVQPGDATVRDATAYDPAASTRPTSPSAAASAQPRAVVPDDVVTEVAPTPAPQAADAAQTPSTTTTATPAPAAQPAAPRPRPAPPPAPRPAPSDDPVGDLLESQPSPQGAPSVPY